MRLIDGRVNKRRGEEAKRRKRGKDENGNATQSRKRRRRINNEKQKGVGEDGGGGGGGGGGEKGRRDGQRITSTQLSTFATHLTRREFVGRREWPLITIHDPLNCILYAVQGRFLFRLASCAKKLQGRCRRTIVGPVVLPRSSALLNSQSIEIDREILNDRSILFSSYLFVSFFLFFFFNEKDSRYCSTFGLDNVRVNNDSIIPISV